MKATPLFALVDCNNFYASCEKLFRPDLAGKPVIVLSNNDGCVVALSREAKALGIKMGVPAFQIRQLTEQHQVAVFSSNYALYADLSQRVMRTLEQLVPGVEMYSIDEAFLDLAGLDSHHNLTELGQHIRQQVGQWTGITVCVGIAPTKTLAKLANHAAKAWPATKGAVDLTSKERQRKLMALLPVADVWGIGYRSARHLQTLGITTALQLADAPPEFIRQHFSVITELTARELRGEPCLEVEQLAPPKKAIMSSRSFGERITSKYQMKEAIMEYVELACRKLRRQKQLARQLTLYLRTNPHNKTEHSYYSASRSASLDIPGNDTRDFMQLAAGLLDKLWQEGYRYVKAGIMLSDLYDPGVFQPDLFTAWQPRTNSSALMAVLDQLNANSRKVLWFAGQGIEQPWKMKRALLSPAYTTRWQDIAIVH